MAHYTGEQPHSQGHESMFHIFTKELLWQTLVHQGAANETPLICSCTCIDTHVVAQRRPHLSTCLTH